MSIKYDHNALISLFGTPPKIYDPEANLCEFTMLDEHGFSLELYLSPYDGFCALTLKKMLLAKPIYALGLERTTEIQAFKDKLDFYHKKSATVLINYLQPNFALLIDRKLKQDHVQDFPTISPMRYNKYDLIELFSALPKVIAEKTSTCGYTTDEDKNGFIFSLAFSEQENNATITLRYKAFELPIFAFELMNVVKIATEPEKLKIYREGLEDPVVVYFKPSFSLELDLESIL